ncbi:MAG: SGNH/GDSL hydrolase family protein [Prolixibacteraceae bacterium]|nr:SGNH/GDSL hydrolase family protein [Prolixibacteraceae bacterium]
MKRKNIISLLLLALFTASCISQKITREDIEWSEFWWTHEQDITKPRVLFIGNSISKGYFPKVANRLEGTVNCDRYSSSRSIEDPALFTETKLAMANYNHRIIHFNNGLHGWHLTNEQYEKGLEKYVKFLKSNKSSDCVLIYSLTTPYPSAEPGQKLHPLNNQIVLDRNQIARKIMEENGIPVIDLYGLMEPELDSYSSSKGDVHYIDRGYEMMAELISEKVLKLLDKIYR